MNGVRYAPEANSTLWLPRKTGVTIHLTTALCNDDNNKFKDEPHQTNRSPLIANDLTRNQNSSLKSMNLRGPLSCNSVSWAEQSWPGLLLGAVRKRGYQLAELRAVRSEMQVWGNLLRRSVCECDV
ncbi:hypothetical protein ACMD2_22211 [Ananas comosus]|uniref:Uncharacterized protein n=1 Tax=Ananas comosus TaxID=4615 RepID=A0A199W0V0_ANACO|nr:hypothetical protein ACMD2_22211 [Ananas comosus]